LATEASSAPVVAEKCLSFRLGEETYGIAILKVQEIIGMMQITRVPCVPEFVRGVINLRGRVIPVTDLRVRFKFPNEDTELTCIIVVEVAGPTGSVTLGVVVDEVSEVIDIPADQLEAVPDFGTAVDTRFLRGMGKRDQQVVLLLDIDEILSVNDFAALVDIQA
jgi:purine-binding chemotaxis protein CheW